MFFCQLVTQEPQDSLVSHFILEVIALVAYTISNFVKISTKKMVLYVKPKELPPK